MDVKKRSTICEEIDFFVSTNGGDNSEFYIGITNNLSRRIVEDEELSEHINDGSLKVGSPIYQANAGTRNIAVSIEQTFQEMGMQKYNPRAKGVEDSKYVYCFKLNEEEFEILLEEEDDDTEKDIDDQINDVLNGKSPNDVIRKPLKRFGDF